MIVFLRNVVLNNLPPRCVHFINVLKNLVLSKVEPELGHIHSLIEPGTDVIDVGGHLGLYSYVFQKYAKRVFTIEPQPRLANYLRQVMNANVEVKQMAFSDSKGQVALRIPRTGNSNNDFLEAFATVETSNQFESLAAKHLEIIEVSKDTMDSLYTDTLSVSLIKIDVEGHELSVLRGGTKIIDRDRPSFMIEISSKYNRDVDAVFDFLFEKDYCAFFYNGQYMAVTPEIIELLKKDREFPHINFFFVPKDKKFNLFQTAMP